MGLSRSAAVAEAKESKLSTDDKEEGELSESEETSSSSIRICSSSISDVSDPDAPNRSLFIAAFAASTNHSSSGNALRRYNNLSLSRKQFFC